MAFLWQSRPLNVDQKIMHYLAGDDVVLDREIFLYDIAATRAHVEGLENAEILSAEERAGLVTSLDALAEEFVNGRFVLDERFEDGHSAIESWLTERLGALGEKVHTGRSRNDQVLVATRLLLRDSLDALAQVCRDIATACLAQAESHRDWPMPGYTHLQRAVVTSVGTWFAGYAEAFIDNAALAQSTRAWINANPLGTAAGFGVNLALDRDHTTKALKFDRLQLNPMYAQNSRGKFELQTLNAVAQAMLDLRRYAWDVSLFSSAEFGFVTLPDRYTTGSSIMPNKRNPDVIELMRAAYGVMAGALAELQSVLSLPGGYHRDLQGTKAPLLRALKRSLDSLALLPDLIRDVAFDRAALERALDAQLFTTDRALALAAEGRPFRQAYRDVKEQGAEGGDPAVALAAKVSPGASGRLMLATLRERLADLT